MFKSLFTRRRGVAAATAALGLATAVSGLSLAFAGTAGAATVINGSGSNTIYQLDIGLSTLFDEAPGCNLAGGSPQPLDFSCPTPYATGGVVNQPGEDGETATLENPYNDVVYQDPALGSGNGVNQLNEQGTTGVAPISFARSSALPANSHGTTADNYVQFATDGVPWVHFTADGKTKLATAKITTLTLSDLQAIYQGTQSCTITKGKSTTTYAMNWICFGAKTSTPIDCYMAQSGSGTEGTWAAAMGTSALPGCLQKEAFGPGGSAVDSTNPTEVAAAAASHAGLFENEISSITSPTSKYYNGDVADAIYFFSYGKFSVECTVKGAAGACPGSQGYTTSLGEINGITADAQTIQGNGDGSGVTFPVTRYLSNVYANSSAATPSNQATLNFASEYGFLCKPGTASDIDPYTGYNYRYEIESTILENGFFPIDTGYNASTQTPGKAFAEGSVTFPADITDANYQLVDPTYNQSDPQGYCLPING